MRSARQKAEAATSWLSNQERLPTPGSWPTSTAAGCYRRLLFLPRMPAPRPGKTADRIVRRASCCVASQELVGNLLGHRLAGLRQIVLGGLHIGSQFGFGF